MRSRSSERVAVPEGEPDEDAISRQCLDQCSLNMDWAACRHGCMPSKCHQRTVLVGLGMENLQIFKAMPGPELA
eukprot:1150720-Pelagomonas_calceolata.AAC.5